MCFLQGEFMDSKDITPSDSFENLSKSIVQYVLRNTNAQITQTRSNKDGGYDIIVEHQDDNGIQRAFFECKLRGANLNLRDIAANVIIAFNHGAVALVAITNHDFTQQAGEELLAFRKNTVLNIKIIVGKEVHRIVDECGIPITSELCNYLNIKTTKRKDDFHALQIDFDKDILCQIFGKTKYTNQMIDPLIFELFHNEIRNISSSIKEGHLISVSGYLGVGKQDVILSSIDCCNKYVISIDASFYQTKDLVILNLLAQIWGIPTLELFSSFSRKDMDAITKSVGDQNNNEETVSILTSLMNEDFSDRRASARQNVLLSEYITKLLVLHAENIGHVVYIRKLQFACKEVYDFLIYFAKHLARSVIPCIISYQNPEYEIQEGKKPLQSLCHVDGYRSYQIKPLSSKAAQLYIERRYPGIPSYISKMIVARVGTRLYNLNTLLKALLSNTSIFPSESKSIAQRLYGISPNDIGNQISYILPYYKRDFAALFEAFFIFECKIPIKIFSLLDVSNQELIELEHAGLFCSNYGYIVTQNEFIYEWIMASYSKSSLSIHLRANELLRQIEEQHMVCNTERIILYQIVGQWKAALNLLEADLLSLKRDKQYTLLRKELKTAISIAVNIHDHVKESEYLISLLEILTIQKEINTDEAKQWIFQLENCIKHSTPSEAAQCALSYFKLKRAFKIGQYLEISDSSIQLGKMYYDACMSREMVDNSGDWLGRICSCYALMIKETQGNEVALDIFKNTLAVFPSSFELRREYYSHIACMQLYEYPLLAFSNYSKILSLFKNEAPDSAALPFHEYGDQAMSQLMACNLEYALKLANDAIEISQSNGLDDEEGRCQNIRGCIQWCMGNLEAAETSFREATAIMCDSGYIHYAWRSQLNFLQIVLQRGTYLSTRTIMLETLYKEFKHLLYEKINSLSKSSIDIFRKTREYHALLTLGFLWNKVSEGKDGCKIICRDFELREHKTQYMKDLESILSGNYDFMFSPYIQNGFIYFVG